MNRIIGKMLLRNSFNTLDQRIYFLMVLIIEVWY